MKKIIFYSNDCEYCNKLLEYLNKYNLNDMFKLIDIKTIKSIPEYITSVPTLIDSNLNQPLKNKQVFEYLINFKYFNNPTNNINLISTIENPKIVNDTKAYKNINNNLEINETTDFYSNNQENMLDNMKTKRNNQDTRLSLLLKKKN